MYSANGSLNQAVPSRTPQLPPVIGPVPDNGKRPLWSVMIPAYNCLSFLQETLESVLAQGFAAEEMQIEVVDDCSTDGDVAALVQRVGKGRVSFYQQQYNTGSLRNFETCINRAKGRYIHLLHGDDRVGNGFYREVAGLFETYTTVGAVITGTAIIDENGKQTSTLKKIQDSAGIIDNWLYRIAQVQMIQAPAVVVKRSVYEQLGGYFAVHYGEDWEMYVRIAARYPVAYSPALLSFYRVHAGNISAASLLTGRNMSDTRKVIRIIQDYLPEHHRKHLKKIARRNFSHFFAFSAQQLFVKRGSPKAVLKQSLGALKMHVNRITISLFCTLFFRCTALLVMHYLHMKIFKKLNTSST